jgi:hypothetical protein
MFMIFLLGLALGSGITFFITRFFFQGKLHSNFKAYLFDINIIRENNRKLLRTNRLLRKSLRILRGNLATIKNDNKIHLLNSN